ncbi:MAG: hypothetical protein ACE5F8_07185 [Woeseiaceae bacterium]
MSHHSQTSLPTMFGVTIAFVLGVTAVTLVLFVISEFVGNPVAADWSATNWYQQGLTVIAVGALAGLIVDGLRLLADVF